MEIWKEIPSWFHLSNYQDSIKYTAKEWINEISPRLHYLEIMKNSKHEQTLKYSDSGLWCEDWEVAAKFFNMMLKKKPLLSQKCELINPSSQKMLDSFKNLPSSSVNEIDESTAYSFLLFSENKTEIDNDFLGPHDFKGLYDYENHRNHVWEKYSQSIGNLVELYEGNRFLKIDMNASDEQILKEFNIWLRDIRNSSNKFIKRNFSTEDFRSWFDAKILPYWDLTTIAEIEKAIIPNHVLGNTLFPEEFNVDLTERIRKVTRKKCQLVFSNEVCCALEAQITDENTEME